MSEDQLRRVFAEGRPDWVQEHTKTALGAQDVIELLDTQSFSNCLAAYPTERAGIIERIEQERLIDCSGGNHYSMRRIGALLLAKPLEEFPELARKAPRVVVYTGISKLEIRLDQVGVQGYAVGFQGLVRFVMAQLPGNEVIKDALRTEAKLLPEVAIRELAANVLIHQDLTMTGTSVMFEAYSNRVEITNPGEPVGEIHRWLSISKRAAGQLNEANAHLRRKE